MKILFLEAVLALMRKPQHPVKDFFTIDPPTRRGYVVVLLVLLGSLSIYILTPMLQSPPTDTEIPKELQQKWMAFKQQVQAQEEEQGSKDFTESSAPLTPFAFDPNTVDSASLLKMGLPHYTIQKWMNWRRHGKIFREKDELKELYTLREEQYQQLLPYISIDASFARKKNKEVYSFPAKTVAPDRIDFNSTDAKTLALLWGIGDFTAKKLIERRDALGGFYRIEQVTEAWKFEDTVYQILRKTLVIDPQKIKRLPINSATQEQLAKHPYIGEKMAKNIVLFREGMKSFSSLSALRQVPLMNEEIYRKIAPYLTLE